MRFVMFTTLACFFLFTPAGFGSDGGDKVAEGIRLFQSGDFEGAGRSFAEADVLLPDDAGIAFDRGCAFQARADWEKARDFYNRAALARDRGIAAAARYNLGTVDAASAGDVFGERPEDASPEQREEGLAFLESAIRHFRDCLEVEPGHASARHNLEALRLWIKQMKALWEEKDRQKKRDELDVLRFIEMIQGLQLEIRSAVKEIIDEPDSPRRREAVSVAESDQRKLREEIDYLKEKITEALKPAASPAGQGPPQADENLEQALELLHGWNDEAGEKMIEAADLLAGGSPEDASDPQWEAFEALDRIYGALAPFEQILRKSIDVESGLVDRTVPLVENRDGESENLPAERGEADLVDMGGFQERVTRWAGVFPFKADQAAQQAETMAAQPAPAQGGEDPPKNMEEQIESLKKACAKAKELAPVIGELSREAAASLREENPDGALPKEEEALKLLKEIADLLPKNEKQQGGDDQKEGKQDQQQDQKQDQKQDQRQKEKQKKRDLSREEAEAILRQSKERERKYKEKKAEQREGVGLSGGVDKDW